MSDPSTHDTIDETLPEDLIVSTDLDDEERFEAISTELANKNARRILREVARGDYNTSTLISEKTGLTIQDVITHLRRLEEIGLIEGDGIDNSTSLRGRSAKRYRVSRLAVLLIPSGAGDESKLREQLRRKSAALLRKRLFVSIAASVAWALLFVSFALQSEVQRITQSSHGENSTSIPQPPLEIIGHLSPDFWIVITAFAAVSSVGVFLISKWMARATIH